MELMWQRISSPNISPIAPTLRLDLESVATSTVPELFDRRSDWQTYPKS